MSNFSPAIEASLLSTDATEQDAQEQFLQFRLGQDTRVMLPITQLIEALTISFGQIVPIPHLPAWVMGVYNWRGEILWMIDLGHLVGFTPWHQQVVNTSTHRAIMKHDRSQRAKDKSLAIGLVVSQVEGIEWCSPDQIYSPPASAVTPELAPFLRGFWLKPNGDMLTILDGRAILAAMPKA